jgi:hypothetical protein
MQNVIRTRTKIALLFISLAVSIDPSTALAQSGSAGGSIGNDEKSLSGSRPAPQPAEPERSGKRSNPEVEQTRRSASRGGGGGGNFDGAWVVVGIGTPCSGSSDGGGCKQRQNFGEGVSGRVSASGSASAVGNSNGITVKSVGRLSGCGGSGTFRQSDGCAGRWTASKQ